MQEVSMLLTCKHVNYRQIESAVFVPKVDDETRCAICHQNVRVSKVSPPYYMGQTAPLLREQQNEKGRA